MVNGSWLVSGAQSPLYPAASCSRTSSTSASKSQAKPVLPSIFTGEIRP